MSINENNYYLNNNELKENPKLKYIIISKKAKSDKISNNEQIISLKKEEGKMELRMENISENITKKKIDQTLKSFIHNKSISDFKLNKKKYKIVDNSKSNTQSERENYIQDKNSEKNHNKKYNTNYYLEKEKLDNIKAIKNLNKQNLNEDEKNNNIYINVNNETKNNNSKNNNISNNTYVEEENFSIKNEIIFINNKNKTNVIKERNINNINDNLIKNFEEMKTNTEVERNKFKKGINTEPNNNNNNMRSSSRESLKRDNITNEDDDDYDEELDEDIFSNKNKNDNENKINKSNNKLSSYRDFESNIAIKNDQSEKGSKFFKNIISMNNFNSKENEIVNNEAHINYTIANNEISNKNFREINLIDSKELAHNKTIYNEEKNRPKINPRENNNSNNNNESKKIVFFSHFNKHRNNIVSFPNNYNINQFQKICSICENKYSAIKFFVAECGIHYICKKCAKNYFEEQIENGETNLHCPFLFCKKKFPQNLTKFFISEEHYYLLEKNEKNKKNKNNNLNKLKNDIYYEEMKLYSKNNVIDINNNKLLYKYNKNKDIFCSKCNKDALFSKTNTYFLKCLNCGHSECKYCFKDYYNGHMDINRTDRCKVYYRRKEDYLQINSCFFFLIQLFLVFAMFFMIFISIFLNIKKFSDNKLRFIKKNKFCCFYYFKTLFIIFYSIVILAVLTPFIVIFHPFFPYILAVSDY